MSSSDTSLREENRACASPIKAARALLGMRQGELARELGRNRSWVSRVESGEIDPSPTEQAKIAQILGLPISTLFPEDPE